MIPQTERFREMALESLKRTPASDGGQVAGLFKFLRTTPRKAMKTPFGYGRLPTPGQKPRESTGVTGKIRGKSYRCWS